MPIDISSLTDEERAELLAALSSDGEPSDDEPTEETTDEPTDENSLLDEVRIAVRVVSDATDVELEALIDGAIAEMRRIGIRDELLQMDSLSPLAKNAIYMYCKAMYGFGNGTDAPMFWQWFQHSVTALANSDANESLYVEEEPDENPEPDADGTTDGEPDDEPGEPDDGSQP
jgi:hypothetical protein